MKISAIIYILMLFAIASCQESMTEIAKPEPIKIEVPNTLISFKHKEIEKKQNGDIYFSNELFSGYLITYHENDSLASKLGYLNGKRNGLSVAFYPNGLLMHERPYLNGEKHGEHIGYHQSGQKKFHYIFVNGFSQGNHKKWYPDGSLLSDMNYKDGKELGKQQMWRPDGKLRSNYIVRENGRRYGLQGIKRCTKLDGKTQEVDPYKGS